MWEVFYVTWAIRGRSLHWYTVKSVYSDRPRETQKVVFVDRFLKYVFQWETIFKGNKKCACCRQVVFVDRWSLKQVWRYFDVGYNIQSRIPELKRSHRGHYAACWATSPSALFEPERHWWVRSCSCTQEGRKRSSRQQKSRPCRKRDSERLLLLPCWGWSQAYSSISG